LKKNPIQIAKLLTIHNKQVNTIVSEARRLNEIKIIISQSLDQQVADHIEVAKARSGVLTLITDSPVWATRIRYTQSEIINSLKNYAVTKNIHSLSVKVQPIEFSHQQKKHKRKTLSISHESARRMLDTIDSISDPQLKLALIRITKHAK